jgi:hypothetical protein
MPNKPTTLRESELKEEFRNWFRDKGDMYYHDVDIADWWLSKFDSHNTELLNKYENCPQCTGLRDEFKAELLQKIEGLESAGTNADVIWRHDVINLIKQNK